MPGIVFCIGSTITKHHDDLFFGFLQPQPHEKSDCWKKRIIENKNKNKNTR